MIPDMTPSPYPTTVDRPLFIVSPARCGTSLLYRCLGDHPDVGYFNRANRKLPRHPRLAWMLTRLGLFKDTKRESRSLWNRYLTTTRDPLDEGDATPAMRERYGALIAGVLAARGASRFVGKLPAFSVRVPWLDALFPDGRFLRILRDWRAVVGSTAAKGRDDFDGEIFGVRPAGWEEHTGEGLEMWAAWQYVRVSESLEQQRPRLGPRYHEIWYEDLCLRPVETLRELLAFCELRASERCEAALLAQVRPPSQQWREHLGPAVLDRIVARHGEAITRYEYPPRGR
jgi:hypothetical protein